ncbi:MAG: CHRD domain-containing protein, partial [Chloroflexota bacterium]
MNFLTRVSTPKGRVIVGIVTLLALLAISMQVPVIAQDHGHGTFDGESRPELQRESPIELQPEAAPEIGLVYEAYLSPQQQAGEEEDTPAFTPQVFQSTAPSVPREERPARGHAVIEFTNDLSRAYVHLEVINLDPETVNLLHLHCGRPGQLGPIIVDFGMMGDVSEYIADGRMTIEITNADLEMVVENGEGFVGAFTAGCPIIAANPTDRFQTIGGLAYVAEQGELYFNLHTEAQTFYGDARGAFRPVID